MPPVAKMTFSFVGSWEGVLRDVAFGGGEEVEGVFVGVDGAEEELVAFETAEETADLAGEEEEVTTAGVVVGVDEPGKGMWLSGIWMMD